MTGSNKMNIVVTGGSGFIGTHLLELLRLGGHQITNIDICEPKTGDANDVEWRDCSILNKEQLVRLFQEMQPSHVVHLAAYASMDARSLGEFSANIDGTANLLDAIKSVSSVERVIITSTQHVRRPGSGIPDSDTDFVPYMFYGESKVISERLTREAGLKCVWTIIRPTAVWGPGHLPLAEGLWRLMIKGRYFHPANDPVVRSYGYVKNVVWQIARLLEADELRVDRKVFYVADGTARQKDWVNAMSRELIGRDVRILPLWMIRQLANVGDGARALGIRFPIYGSRLENLITNNPVPIESTLELLGDPPYSLERGAFETSEWLKKFHQFRGRGR